MTWGIFMANESGIFEGSNEQLLDLVRKSNAKKNKLFMKFRKHPLLGVLCQMSLEISPHSFHENPRSLIYNNTLEILEEFCRDFIISFHQYPKKEGILCGDKRHFVATVLGSRDKDQFCFGHINSNCVMAF